MAPMVHVSLIRVANKSYTLRETKNPPIDKAGKESNYAIDHDQREILVWASALDKCAYAAAATSECWRDVCAPVAVNQGEVLPLT